MLEFAISIKPQGKPRHRTRVVMIGRKPVAMQYADPKGVKFEKAIRDAVMSQYDGEPLDGPLCLNLLLVFKKPKSSKLVYPEVKPDASNVLKAIEDALNGVLWHDDKQICSETIQKLYGDRDLITFEVTRL